MKWLEASGIGLSLPGMVVQSPLPNCSTRICCCCHVARLLLFWLEWTKPWPGVLESQGWRAGSLWGRMPGAWQLDCIRNGKCNLEFHIAFTAEFVPWVFAFLWHGYTDVLLFPLKLQIYFLYLCILFVRSNKNTVSQEQLMAFKSSVN